MTSLISKKNVLIIIILIVIFLVGFYSAKPQSPRSDSESVVILMSATAFTPSEVTLQEGDSIIFRNGDTEDHWPASDAHPSHTEYPQFDPKESVVPGAEWKFTFNQVGTWRYHDHVNPLLRGVVTVVPRNATQNVEDNNSVNSEVNCSPESTDFYCYEMYYSKLVKDTGVASAFTELQAQYEEKAYIQSQCHPLTHVIGRTTVSLYPDVAEAFTQGNSLCWSGYYHGVMEGIVGEIGKEEIVSKLASICNGIPGKEYYSFDYYNCVHGLGHGLMALSENELFDSLATCDNLVGAWEQSSCYGGVFMENVIVDNKNHFTKYLKPEDPVYPCSAVDSKYKTPCYLMQTSYMLKVTNNDFKKVFDLCAEVEDGYREICYQSLGRDASGQSISVAETTKQTCELGTDYNQQSNCIIGAVKDFISFHHSDVEAKRLCEIIDPSLTQVCLDTAQTYYATF